MHTTPLLCGILRAILVAGLILVGPLSAIAQNQTASKNEATLQKQVDIHFQKSSLSAMLRDLSKRYGVVVMVDGIPLLESADIDFRGSLRDALDRIADAFDYTVTVHKSGIVSMMKRFKNPQERPQAVPAEIRQTAADMLTILPVLPYDTNEPPLWAREMRQLAPRLSPEQMESLKAGKELLVSSLPPNLQPALTEILLLRAYGDARSMWEKLYRQLDRFESSMLRARKKGMSTPTDDAKSTASFSVVHESRSPGGLVTTTAVGEIQKAAKP